VSDASSVTVEEARDEYFGGKVKSGRGLDVILEGFVSVAVEDMINVD
jgi:hypothetical protein